MTKREMVALVNDTDVLRRNPLGAACDNAQELVEIATTLVAAKANVGAKDSNGNSALHLAARRGHVAVVKLLLENNANANATNNCKQTPMMLAAKPEAYESDGKVSDVD